MPELEPLPLNRQFVIDVCKFILIQSKVHKWLMQDKRLAREVVAERLEADATPIDEMLKELMIN